MKKNTKPKKITAIALMLLTIMLGAGYILLNMIYMGEDSLDNTSQKSQHELLTQNEDENEEYTISDEEIEAKRNSLRKRISLSDLINIGDRYLIDKEYDKAIRQYLVVLAQNPSDNNIKEKLVFAYSKLHRYKNTKKYLSTLTISENNIYDIFHILGALVLSGELTSDEAQTYLKNAKNLSLEERFYYTTSLTCLEDLHICKQDFVQFIDEKVDNDGIVEPRKIEFGPLVDVKKAITDYRNFGLEDIELKNVFLAGAFVKNEMYPVSAKFSSAVLENKPGYHVAELIAGMSYYYLGDYDSSVKYLKRYERHDNKNPKVYAMLSAISLNQKQYSTAINYANKAKKYYGLRNTPSYVFQNIIFAENETKNVAGTIKAFDSYYEYSDEVEKSDYEYGIFYAITNKNFEKAKRWIVLALRNYESDPLILGYRCWVERELGQIDKALQSCSQAESLSSETAFIHLQYGLTFQAAKDNRSAKKELQLARKYATDATLAAIAQQELRAIADDSIKLIP